MTSKSVLRNILITLVREWGREEVEATLRRLGDTAPELSDYRPVKNRSRKLPAVEQVEKGSFPTSYHSLLIEIASRYDRKEFLPTTADVREFLLMMGQRPGGMKDRSEAFRRLLNVISALPADQLEKLAVTALHSGPSQLGPLSDAISSAAESLEPRRRNRFGDLKR
jgi:hypothetical protein